MFFTLRENKRFLELFLWKQKWFNGIALETPIWNLCFKDWMKAIGKPSSSGYLHILALADNTIQQNNIKKCLPRDIQKKKECHRRTILGCVNDQKVSFSVEISPQLTGNILLLIAINTTLDLSQSSTVLKCLQRMINTLDTHRDWFSNFPLQNCEQRWAGISCSQSTELKIRVRGIEEKKIKQKIRKTFFCWSYDYVIIWQR